MKPLSPLLTGLPFFSLLCILAVLNFIQCTNPNSGEQQANDTLHAPLTRAERKKLQGLWLNRAYYHDLMQHRSPRKSQDIGTVSFLKFRFPVSDSVLIVYGFHEGLEVPVFQTQGKLFLQREEHPMDELVLASGDSTLEIFGETFVRTTIPAEPENEERILEALLFQGKYEWEGKEVALEANGRVEGWADFRRYKPLADYNDAGMDVDQLQLFGSKEEPQSVGFRFSSDSLFIYELNCLEYDSLGHQCGVVENGRILYTLKKRP
jgi:hypothetical protein